MSLVGVHIIVFKDYPRKARTESLLRSFISVNIICQTMWINIFVFGAEDRKG